MEATTNIISVRRLKLQYALNSTAIQSIYAKLEITTLEIVGHYPTSDNFNKIYNFNCLTNFYLRQ